MSETTFENSTLSGNNIKVGQTSYNKYLDNTTGKWERLSGSGAPNVNTHLIDSTGSNLAILESQLMVISTATEIMVARGSLPGAQNFTEIGNLTALGATSEVDMWPNGGKYVFPSTPMQMEIVSTSAQDHKTGSGIQQCLILYLDDTYTSKSEIINLSGSTAVPTIATNILRVNTLRAYSVGTSAVASGSAGTINLRHINDTPVYRVISQGQTRGRTMVFTSPVGITAFITTIVLSSVNTQAGHYTKFTFRTNYDEQLDTKISFMMPLFETILQDQTATIRLTTPILIQPTCDFVISCIGDNANNQVTAFLSGTIEI